MKKVKLFKEFSPNTSEQWEEKIKEDLKGASYEKRLVWNTLEGFKVNPYYRKENLIGKDYLETLPGESPYIRGNRITSNNWSIRQDIAVDDIKTANQNSLFILDKGITSLGFIVDSEKGKIPFHQGMEDFSKLTKGISFDRMPLHFICGRYGPEIMDYFIHEVETRKMKQDTISGSFDFDPLGYLTIHGNYFISEKADFESLHKFIQLSVKKLPLFKVIGINGYFFNNAGASVVQELGYSLAMANDYLDRMSDTGIDPDTICQRVQFNFGVGSNYFMEIAKIRAARFLWSKIAGIYQVKKESSKKAYIHSITSKWNQTVYDPYVNVLRATTEAMSAVIGGTDSLVVRPFTDACKPSSKFSDRVARNIQIILREEAYLGKIVDPAAGSYYIEILTESIIHESWKLFLHLEEHGGYLEAFKKGLIQSDLSNTIQNRNNSIATRKEILMGTNQYPNLNESLKKEVVDRIAFPPLKNEKPEITPIKKSRGSMDIERIRLATENHSKGHPKAFMLTYGNPAMRKACATFACNFFACGGYKLIENRGFSSPEEGVDKALKSKADIVVVCSSDEEYTSLVPKIKNLIQDKAILVVAGAPNCMESLKSKGIKNFIHLRSNVVESLKKFHHELGIKI